MMTSLLDLPDEVILEIAEWLDLRPGVPLPEMLSRLVPTPMEPAVDGPVSAAPDPNGMKYSAYWDGPHATGSYPLRSTCRRLRTLVPLHRVEHRLPVDYTLGDLVKLTNLSERSRAATRRFTVEYRGITLSPPPLGRTVFTLLDAFRGLEYLDVAGVSNCCWVCDARHLDCDAARVLDAVKKSRLKVVKLTVKEGCGTCTNSQHAQTQPGRDTMPRLSPFFFLAAPHLEALLVDYCHHDDEDTMTPWNVLIQHTPGVLSNLKTLQCFYYWSPDDAIANICRTVPYFCPRLRHLSVIRAHYLGDNTLLSHVPLCALFTSLSSSEPCFPDGYCRGFTPSRIGHHLSAFRQLVQFTLNLCIHVHVLGRGLWNPLELFDDVHAEALSDDEVQRALRATDIQTAIATHAPDKHREWLSSVNAALLGPSVRAVLKSAKMISASCPSLRRGNLFIKRNPLYDDEPEYFSYKFDVDNPYIECHFTVGDQPGTIASLTTSSWPGYSGKYDLLQFLGTAPPTPTFDWELQDFLIELAGGPPPKKSWRRSLFGLKGRKTGASGSLF